jgi:hypothetical protein
MFGAVGSARREHGDELVDPLGQIVEHPEVNAVDGHERADALAGRKGDIIHEPVKAALLQDRRAVAIGDLDQLRKGDCVHRTCLVEPDRRTEVLALHVGAWVSASVGHTAGSARARLWRSHSTMSSAVE